ncbi:MAG: AraC family transcriptional regulator [Pseudomonadota bacterium]
MPNLSETKIETVCPGIRIVSLATDYTFSRHSHDEFGLGLITRGGHQSYSGHGMVEAIAGDMISVCPDEIHDGMPLDERGRSWTMLYFDVAIFGKIAKDENCDASQDREFEFLSPVIKDRANARAFKALFRLATARNDAFEGEFDEALTNLVVPLLRKRKPREQPVEDRIAHVIERICDDPANPIKLEELAALAGASRFQTIRAVRKRTGFTPFGLIRQKRLDLARRLIQAGIAISDAAVKSGYSDQAHLTRAFRSAYGITPGMLLRSRFSALQ